MEHNLTRQCGLHQTQILKSLRQQVLDKEMNSDFSNQEMPKMQLAIKALITLMSSKEASIQWTFLKDLIR